MSNLKSFLIPPRSNTDGGVGSNHELTTAEEIRGQTEGPVRNAHIGIRHDAISYLVHNATSGPDEQIDVRRTLNVRWNLSWEKCDAAISEVKELAEIEIAKVKGERVKNEQSQAEFKNLAALFDAMGLQIQSADDRYSLNGLSVSQIRLCADVLAAKEGVE